MELIHYRYMGMCEYFFYEDVRHRGIIELILILILRWMRVRL